MYSIAKIIPCHVRSDVVTFPKTDVLLCFILVLVFASKGLCPTVRNSRKIGKTSSILLEEFGICLDCQVPNVSKTYPGFDVDEFPELQHTIVAQFLEHNEFKVS